MRVTAIQVLLALEVNLQVHAIQLTMLLKSFNLRTRPTYCVWLAINVMIIILYTHMHVAFSF